MTKFASNASTTHQHQCLQMMRIVLRFSSNSVQFPTSTKYKSNENVMWMMTNVSPELCEKSHEINCRCQSKWYVAVAVIHFISYLRPSVSLGSLPHLANAGECSEWIISYNKVIVCVCNVTTARHQISSSAQHVIHTRRSDAHQHLTTTTPKQLKMWREIFHSFLFRLVFVWRNERAGLTRNILCASENGVYLHFICASHLLTTYELFTIFKSQLLHRSVSWQKKKKNMKIYISESLPFVVLRTTYTTHRVISFGQQHQCQCRSRDLPANKRTHTRRLYCIHIETMRRGENDRTTATRRGETKDRERERETSSLKNEWDTVYGTDSHS